MAGVKAEPAGDWISPSVGSTVAVNMATDRSCPGFPGKKLKCTLPSHFELPVALWLLLPPDTQPDLVCLCASVAYQWASDNRWLIPAWQTLSLPGTQSRAASLWCLAPYLLPATQNWDFLLCYNQVMWRRYTFSTFPLPLDVSDTCWCWAGEKCIVFPKARGMRFAS